MEITDKPPMPEKELKQMLEEDFSNLRESTRYVADEYGKDAADRYLYSYHAVLTDLIDKKLAKKEGPKNDNS